MVQAIILQGTLKSSKNTMLENDNIDLSWNTNIFKWFKIRMKSRIILLVKS
jgi:hypothetical protein